MAFQVYRQVTNFSRTGEPSLGQYTDVSVIKVEARIDGEVTAHDRHRVQGFYLRLVHNDPSVHWTHGKTYALGVIVFCEVCVLHLRTCGYVYTTSIFQGEVIKHECFAGTELFDRLQHYVPIVREYSEEMATYDKYVVVAYVTLMERNFLDFRFLGKQRGIGFVPDEMSHYDLTVKSGSYESGAHRCIMESEGDYFKDCPATIDWGEFDGWTVDWYLQICYNPKSVINTTTDLKRYLALYKIAMIGQNCSKEIRTAFIKRCLSHTDFFDLFDVFYRLVEHKDEAMMRLLCVALCVLYERHNCEVSRRNDDFCLNELHNMRSGLADASMFVTRMYDEVGCKFEIIGDKRLDL